MKSKSPVSKSTAAEWSRTRAFTLVIVFVSLPYLAVLVLAGLVHPLIAATLIGLVPATPWLYFWAAWITKFVETGDMPHVAPHLFPPVRRRAANDP